MSAKKVSVNEKEIKSFLRFAKKYPIIAGIIVIILIGVFIFSRFSDKGATKLPSDASEGLYVHYIDIGQGDAELVSCDGEYMLIDGGDVDKGEALAEYLEENGVERLEYVVCTHGHADHCGGLDEVISGFEVGEVLTSPYPGDRKVYEVFVDTCEECGVNVSAPEMGESFFLGEASFNFIGPLEDYDDLNANSLVMRLEYGQTSFLFTGDTTARAEKDLCNEGVKLKCDVLKVAHHGSSGSSCYRFLYEAQPSIAVISCGKDNSYGHPHEETVSRLVDCDARIYRTDTDGSVIIFSDGYGVERFAA